MSLPLSILSVFVKMAHIYVNENLYSDLDKVYARDRCLVMSVDGDWCCICKFVGAPGADPHQCHRFSETGQRFQSIHYCIVYIHTAADRFTYAEAPTCPLSLTTQAKIQP